MTQIILLTGLPGVGKSTILDHLKKIIYNENISCSMINYGDLMLEIAKERNLVKTRDQLRTLSIKNQKKIQFLVASAIKDKSSSLITIIDTHMIIKTKQGFWPGFSAKNLEIISPDQIILVEASPNDILKRRQKDSSRSRDEETLNNIIDEILYCRYVASSCSTLLGAPVKIVCNKQNLANETAKEIFDSIKM